MSFAISLAIVVLAATTLLAVSLCICACEVALRTTPALCLTACAVLADGAKSTLICTGIIIVPARCAVETSRRAEWEELANYTKRRQSKRKRIRRYEHTWAALGAARAAYCSTVIIIDGPSCWYTGEVRAPANPQAVRIIA